MVVGHVHQTGMGQYTNHFLMRSQHMTNYTIQARPTRLCPCFNTNIRQFTKFLVLFSFFTAMNPRISTIPTSQLFNRANIKYLTPTLTQDTDIHRRIIGNTVPIYVLRTTSHLLHRHPRNISLLRINSRNFHQTVTVQFLHHSFHINNHFPANRSNGRSHIFLEKRRSFRTKLPIQRISSYLQT